MKKREFQWFILIVWLAIFGIFLFVFALEMEFKYAAIRALFLFGWLIVLHYCTLPLVRKYLISGRYLRFGIAACILVTVIAISKGLVELHLLPEAAKPLFFRGHQPRPVFHFLSAASAFLFSYLFWYNHFLKETEKRSLLSQKMQAETQLSLLQAQIQPHSLFNTMNNIYSLVIEQRDEAGEAILKLAEMLRYAVYKKDESAEVSVMEEARQIETLIWLHQIKEDNRFDIVFCRQIHGGKILPMLLIPLVENALKYCDFASNPEANIKINLTSDPARVTFRVTNTFTPETSTKMQGGVGLTNVRNRLELYYPGRYRFEANSDKRIFDVKLELWNQ